MTEVIQDFHHACKRDYRTNQEPRQTRHHDDRETARFSNYLSVAAITPLPVLSLSQINKGFIISYAHLLPFLNLIYEILSYDT